MASSPLGRRRWLGPAVVVALCLTGVGGAFGQGSTSPVPSSAELPAGSGTGVTTARTASAAAAQRKLVRLPYEKSLVRGVVGLSTAGRDTRSKVNLQIPSFLAVAYLDPTYRTPASQTVPVPKYFLPRHPVPGCHYKEGVLFTDLYAVGIRQPNKNKPGVVTNVGRFPATHVSALAFGSVPVTATLNTRQISRRGRLQPLVANTVTSYITADKAGNSCDADWEGGAQTPPLNTVSHAQLAVRISDVRVDKQPIDVGRSCRTVTPLSLNLFGSPGYIAYTGGQLTEKYDPRTVRSGASTYPLHPGSTNLTIPAFVGCVNPRTGEDYSRLLTAMVSGPDNTIAANQSQAILNGIDDKHVTVCLKGTGCVKRPVFVNPPRPGMTGHRAHR